MNYYKQADKKAPRYRDQKYRYNLICKELWERYVKETGSNVPWIEFKEIAIAINEEIKRISIEERSGVMLPGQMGNIWLGLFKVPNKPTDNANSAKLGIEVPYNQYHTNGLQGKIVWDFRHCKYKVRNRYLWGFRAHRDYKIAASKAFHSQPEIYLRNIYKKVEIIKRHIQENYERNSQGNIESGEGTQ